MVITVLMSNSINIVTITPLTENMPGPAASKPGDMHVFHIIDYYFVANSDGSIYAMNGKSVEIDNTDAEGRLVLSGMSS
jgi:aminopeptidase